MTPRLPIRDEFTDLRGYLAAYSAWEAARGTVNHPARHTSCLACRRPYHLVTGGKQLPLCREHRREHGVAKKRRGETARRQLKAYAKEVPPDPLLQLWDDLTIRQRTSTEYDDAIERVDRAGEGSSLSGLAYRPADSARDEDGTADDDRLDGLDLFNHADETDQDREAAHGAHREDREHVTEDRQPWGTYTVDGADEGITTGSYEMQGALKWQAFHAANHPWWVTTPPEVAFFELGDTTVNDWGERVAELTTPRGPKCGTYNGWMRHYRRKEQPCQPCREAKAARNQRDYEKRTA